MTDICVGKEQLLGSVAEQEQEEAAVIFQEVAVENVSVRLTTVFKSKKKSDRKYSLVVGIVKYPTLDMKQEYQDLVLQACGASSVRVGSRIQTLWSGYGDIVRLHLEAGSQAARDSAALVGGVVLVPVGLHLGEQIFTGEQNFAQDRPSVVVKHVRLPHEAERPGGGSTDRSHARKVRSYQVETHWYQNYSTDQSCRVPCCLAARRYGPELVLVLEDLDVEGYDQRRTSVRDREIRACLSWLAHFHALFLGVEPVGLWPVGTYWHLETRPDELEAMDDAELKAAAADIDRKLSECRFKTIVHGDAKLANFCFSQRGHDVAAVDFQYVGGGCGMKDVVYFLGSCMDERECEERVPGLLEHYFTELKLFVKEDVDVDALEKEWRDMFVFAWTDFHRFLLGWMPGHWKVNRYSEQLTKEALHKLRQ
ncbi:uncharacterized protein pkdc [Nematolebias whitei]|uniref:uncharacterized protein pkdc n=1 Tax=Nematolebias whitei TaxID=451745 RepID=UPI001897BD8F|nr:uncharacterized protein pkdc [Nematolebias whitei]